MSTLAPGVLLKLLKAMKTGGKPTGEHRNSLLQVTDIVPANLDFKNLLPKQGFHIRISDSSHSIYVSLPCEQDDLVLSNQLQLGQLIYIEKLEPGSPVPRAKGAKPLPGKHPLTGFGKDEKMGIGIGTPIKEKGSFVIFDSPMSPLVRLKEGNDHYVNSTSRASLGGLASRLEPRPQSPPSVRKTCIAQTMLKFSRSKSDRERGIKIATTPLNSSGMGRCSSPPPNLRRAGGSTSIEENAQKSISSKETPKPQSQSQWFQSQSQSQSSNLTFTPSRSTISVNLSGKLGILGKEAAQQRETAQKVALQALRHATATDNVVRCFKTFAILSKSAKLNSPAKCFDEFLEFHQQLVQAITDIASIQAACDFKTETTESSGSIITQNSMDKVGSGRILRSCSRAISEKKERCCTPPGNDHENKLQPGNFGYLRKMIKLGKQIEMEAGNWFMDFIEQALEMGMKISKGRSDSEVREVPVSLILKVISWVEVEQNDSRKRQVHPKATQIARKLRIKVKNPHLIN